MSFRKIKQAFYLFIHLAYLSGLLYALARFIRTPQATIYTRRLWAYECWIILSFYLFFFYLSLIEQEKGKFWEKFKRPLEINLFLLVFPWGLFLIFAPRELLGLFRLNSIYWRFLGFGSLLGALIYYFPYRFFRKRPSYYILLFGFLDNLLAGLIVLILLFLGRVPLLTLGSVLLLFYFSFFFFDQAKHYEKRIKSQVDNV